MGDVRAEAEPLVIFLHVPKTGGMTFNLVLERNYPGLQTLITGASDRHALRVDLGAWPEERMRGLRCVRGHLEYGVHERFPKPSRYITLLRDPVDRAVSHYRHVLSQPLHYLHERVADEGMTLADYARAGFIEIENGQTRQLVPGAENRACTAADLVAAKRNLDSFLAVGLCERFDETVVLFAGLLGWKLPLYRRANVNSAPRPGLDEVTRRAIEEANPLDLELYAHAQLLFERQVERAGPGFAHRVAWFAALNRSYQRVPPIRTLAVRRRSGPRGSRRPAWIDAQGSQANVIAPPMLQSGVDPPPA
jgi:hypothetical protein